MTPSASPTPSRWTAIALLLAGSVGVPGLVSYFNPEIAKNPKTAIPLLILWELLVLVAGLVTDVWSKLRSRWVDRLVDPIDHALQALFSRYRRRYLDWIFYRHRDFDVKGLTTQSTYNLELEQVFVDLTIQPPPPGGNPADPIRPFPKELTGRHSIWDYLVSEQFTDHLSLIGAPGSGKTTLLKKIALQMTGRRRPKIRQKLPILLFLREHAEAILANPSPSLADVASADLARKHCPVLPPAAWFKGTLDDGLCLVLLDGLDEVASKEVRQKVVTWMETQMTAFPKNRFLISSRPHGYRSCPVSGVTILEVQPFNRDQVRQFVQNWYRANEIHASGKIDPGVEMKAREGAEDLLRRLGNSQALTDLSVNPLLLTMISTVHRFRSSLPGRRVELYAEICEVFLGKRQQARGMGTDLAPSQKQRVLQPLAYRLMHTKKREIPTHEAIMVIKEPLRRVAGERSGSPEVDFLNDIENGSGLLLERESGIYSFAHLAFQEYLTAIHILENGLSSEMAGRVTDPWWHEVIRLYGAQGDASAILEACLSSGRPTISELSLAIECLEEARETDPEWRTKLDTFLSEGAEAVDPDRFRLTAETMLARRLRNMIALNEKTFFDPEYVSHAEYQIFLDDMRAHGRDFKPDHWEGFRFPAGQALTPAVGMRPSDASSFCDWLRARDNIYTYRLPQPREIESQSIIEKTQHQSGTAEGFWTTEGFLSTGRPNYPSFDSEAIVRRDFSQESFARALELTRILDRDLVRAHNRPLDLTHNVDLAYARARARACTIEFASNFNRELALDLEIGDLGLELVRELGHFCLDLNRELNLDRALDCTAHSKLRSGCDALTHDMINAVKLALSWERKPELYKEIRWMWRILSSCCAKGPWSRFPIEFVTAPEEVRRGLWLGIYSDLFRFEARIDGVVPAIEGIRIIKERRS